MHPDERVQQLFGVAIEGLIASADNLSSDLVKAGQRLVDCLLSDKKILICGNGGSAANALHFSGAMAHHFGVDRPAFPVVNLSMDAAYLSSISAEQNYDQAFARPIYALGQSGDVLLVLTTSGNSDSILQAISAAKNRGLDIIALTGREGGVLHDRLGPEDIALAAPVDTPARIREIHLFILHSFCNLIDTILFQAN